jgi:hypothetical protein
MPRYFAKISQDDLKKKIDEAFDGSKYEFIDKVIDDIKVQFDLENFCIVSGGLHGIHTLENGLTFHGMSSHGDWESNTFFIVYFDGKKLRAYVPTDGNPWNTTTKMAYGNDEKTDLKNAKKRWPELYKDAEYIEVCDFEMDYDLIKQDILNRFQCVDEKGKQNRYEKPKNRKKSLQERIESLKFSDGDESSDLIKESCHFCYMLYNSGLVKEAETVCKWAEEMVADRDDDMDKISGYWG